MPRLSYFLGQSLYESKHFLGCHRKLVVILTSFVPLVATSMRLMVVGYCVGFASRLLLVTCHDVIVVTACEKSIQKYCSYNGSKMWQESESNGCS
jgi:hypothetical protein